MDPVSQAVLGASWSQSAAQRAKLRDAALLGAIAGLAPDLDAVIRSSTDPLLFLEYHRHFTHALAFVPIGALACAALLHRLVRARLAFRETYFFCLLGFGSHGLLDACTTYGTRLLWPFSDARIAWSVVAVVDPLFTLPALALVVLAALRRDVRFAVLAAAWAGAYIALGFAQNARAGAAGAALAASRGHVPARLEAKPAFGSLLLWKIIYEHDGHYYVDAVRAGLGIRVFEGESIVKLDLGRHFSWLDPSSQQGRDVERFRHVADDFLALDDRAPNRIVDMRYSMVPNEIDGFWAIELDPAAAPGEHVGFITTRERAPEQALRLLDMLF